MKNYWLRKRNHKKFHSIVVKYQNNNKLYTDEFAKALYELAEELIDYFNKSPNANIDKDDATQDCVMMGYDKVKRFDPSKGKAFNFFTTCML